MTYIPENEGSLTVTEYTLVSQTRTQNSDVVWDNTTKRSTASAQKHNVNGASIVLNGPCCFWLVASPDATRGHADYDFNLSWVNDDTTNTGSIPQNEASFTPTTTQKTSNMTCFTVINLGYGGKATLKLRYTSSYNVTLNDSMSLLVYEVASS